MLINLKSFNDLGKCSYGTLKEVFDTEKEEIYFNKVKVEINSAEDLVKFLWCIPYLQTNNKAYFSSTTPWFIRQNNSYAEHCLLTAAKLKKAHHKDEDKRLKLIEYWEDRATNVLRASTALLKTMDVIADRIVADNV